MSSQRIVVVDDVALNLRVMESLIAELDDVEVITFTSSAEALARAPTLGASLFIIDYRMPPPDGISVLSAIREDPRIGHTPVVVVTAAEEREVCYNALERGASDFLVRPIDPREFTRRIGNLLALDKLRHDAALDLVREEQAARLYARRLDMIWSACNNTPDDATFLRTLIADASWAIVDGRRFSAAIVGLDGGDVVIESANESSNAIPIEDLSDSIARGGIESSSDLPPDLRGAGKWRASIVVPFRAGASRYVLAFRSHEPVAVPFTAFDTSFVETVAQLCATRLRQRAQFARLRYQSEHDSLTGLLNRSSFRTAGIEAMRRSSDLAVLVLNLDNFRHTNESLGQQTGDALLIEVAGRLDVGATERETIARLGGDTFGVLVADCRDRDSASAAAQRFLRAFTYPFGTGDLDGNERVFLAASIGIAQAPGDAPTFEALLGNASAACYAAKDAGRGRAAFFDPAIEEGHARARTLKNELARALERSELTLHFQPHVDLKTRRICGAEALVRWNHPERGLLAPGEFIPFAERHGLAGAIGAWVMGATARASIAWRNSDPAFHVWFNLSAAELRDDTLVARIRDVEGDLAGLGVEVTESVAMENIVDTMKVMERLRELGVKLALDDFGTGYSSLAHLRRLPLDVVKIDRAFIMGLPDDPADGAIVDAVVSIARNYGFATLGEGIEDPHQAAFLLRAGCALGQGYLYGRPMPAAEFDTLLQSGATTARA